jgi:hypothetical protein
MAICKLFAGKELGGVKFIFGGAKMLVNGVTGKGVVVFLSSFLEC